jgi:nitrate reductase gamma subunit
MRAQLTLILIIFLGIAGNDHAEGSWLINDEKFHVSVHGQISCHDCHAIVNRKRFHPDPLDVNKELKDFFRVEQCTDCHDEVLEDMNDGKHGDESVTDLKKHLLCISCHDPHYQMPYSESTVKYDVTLPKNKKCGFCHEPQQDLPELSPEDEQCMACHRIISPEAPMDIKRIYFLCFYCHGAEPSRMIQQKPVHYSLIDVSDYTTTAHAKIPCMICHSGSAEFAHSKQEIVSCLQCHLPHDAKVAHDVHFRIACEACHLDQITPVKNAKTGKIQWDKKTRDDRISQIHQMIISGDKELCQRCHFRGNAIGAAAMVLPAKGVICMPCHVATFSVGDTITILTLILFGCGLLLVGSVWYSGNIGEKTTSGISDKIIETIKAFVAAFFSPQLFLIVKSLFWDAFLQRRLFRISKIRWFIHALIFFPFIFRFSWGLVALFGSLWLPELSGVWVMLDKNYALNAFLFDLSGISVILGVVLIIIYRHMFGFSKKIVGLSRPDWIAYGLLGGIIIIGFILEGMRISLTESTLSSNYAFLGYTLSRLFRDVDLTSIYGYVWYTHAILTGAFIAYLPFSRMFHIIIAPISLAISAISRNSDQ